MGAKVGNTCGHTTKPPSAYGNPERQRVGSFSNRLLPGTRSLVGSFFE